MWRGTRVDATWHARPRGSATRTHTSACMGLMWRGCVAGLGVPMKTPGWRLHGKRVFELASDEPMGIVGPSKFIRAVTQSLHFFPPFIRRFSFLFLCVGLCSLLILESQVTWHIVVRKMKSCRFTCVNLVDLGPLDRHQSMCAFLDRRSRKLDPTIAIKSRTRLTMRGHVGA